MKYILFGVAISLLVVVIGCIYLWYIAEHSPSVRGRGYDKLHTTTSTKISVEPGKPFDLKVHDVASIDAYVMELQRIETAPFKENEGVGSFPQSIFVVRIDNMSPQGKYAATTDPNASFSMGGMTSKMLVEYVLKLVEDHGEYATFVLENKN